MSDPTLNQPIRVLADLIRSGRLTSSSLTDMCLGRIREGTRFNAFTQVFERAARERAQEADRELAAGRDRGLLHGMPISIKDLIDIAGTPTTAASRVREGHVADRDAPLITALRNAGAVIVGKCNLHEFAFGTTSEESAFGAVENSADPGRSAGGSSGGSAVAVQTAMSLASIGSDTGGSIRIPAAACGVVGLKPGYGEISCDGVVPLSRSLDHVGPLARSVEDAAIMYAALLGTRFNGIRKREANAVRLGVPRRYFFDLLDDPIRRLFDDAVERLKEARVRLADVDIPHASDIIPVYLHLALPEAAAYHAASLERTPDAYSPGVRHRLEMARYILAEDYVRAQQGRAVLRDEVDRALDGVDALVLPSLAIRAPVHGAETVEIGGQPQPVRAMMLRLTQLFNLTGHPAISVPGAPVGTGPQCGVQLVGSRDATKDLLEVAHACEASISMTGSTASSAGRS
jgi:aspartyl-tRNA(Asn)/glutamyl-tRNA(Gln) amidotransferase subunit A